MPGPSSSSDGVDPSMPLAGRVALVTGASRGIGAQIARRLAKSGATVVVNYPDESQSVLASQLVQEIVRDGSIAEAVRADVGDPPQIQALFEQIPARHGKLDIVVLNAGGDAVVKSIAETSDEDFDRVMRLNARGQFVAIQAAARLLRHGGRLIFISSSTATQPYPGTASYAGAKIATEAYIQTVAQELAERGITANVVSPGMTATETMLSQTTEARRATVVGATPLGRIAQTADIADVVHFLAGSTSRALNGQVIHVNGGLL
ncbi:3-oxoacyl-[acyl-carrier protein] reductase [Paraburkholderia unamae]|uniref:3-oxoacyl-[acyl-carrier protein] reductase n=2 Tax=Paraburkholderia unamae TaxID=219649 RepID=A0ABX5KVA7_9BURK|nr:3-oxoacyl-[acyl-carrier protein] reductase [Paraburkholderia unamae]